MSPYGWLLMINCSVQTLSVVIVSVCACAWDVSSRCFCFILAGQLTVTSWRVDHQEASSCQTHLFSSQASQCSCEPSKWDDTVLPRVCPHTASPQWGICIWVHHWLNIAAGQTLCRIPSSAKALKQYNFCSSGLVWQAHSSSHLYICSNVHSMSAWPALIASRLTVDQKIQAHQSEQLSAFHCRMYMEMYSCSVCMFPQTTFMWEMSLCLASKISSRSTCLSGKAWVSNHNHPACKLVTSHWCYRFVQIQHTATLLHGHWPHGQKLVCICIIAVTAFWGLSSLSCCLCWDFKMWLTSAHGWAAEIVVSVGMALPQNLMSIQRWKPAQ